MSYCYFFFTFPLDPLPLLLLDPLLDTLPFEPELLEPDFDTDDLVLPVLLAFPEVPLIALPLVILPGLLFNPSFVTTALPYL